MNLIPFKQGGQFNFITQVALGGVSIFKEVTEWYHLRCGIPESLSVL